MGAIGIALAARALTAPSAARLTESRLERQRAGLEARGQAIDGRLRAP